LLPHGPRSDATGGRRPAVWGKHRLGAGEVRSSASRWQH
jgi:hypothetical protein